MSTIIRGETNDKNGPENRRSLSHRCDKRMLESYTRRWQNVTDKFAKHLKAVRELRHFLLAFVFITGDVVK